MKGGKPKASSRNADRMFSVKNPKGKNGKDSNKPKRPPSAFFVFMEQFRTDFKRKHPNNKLVAVVGKAGGVKWNSMSEEDKAPFVAEADKRKKDYGKVLQAYNKKMDGGGDGDESDKSKSEMNKEEDGESSGEAEVDDK
ncbi:unnamed protein product [Cuscuta campestris]|uniref:HMG box domain-containing protein n=1 Tax=Cuscuta campestris TaxID=132261 RepID=A0A484NBJ5_9ASTE|nr:unnamed protein product [Cuscuta campestris]